jgi:hypothetical protein
VQLFHCGEKKLPRLYQGQPLRTPTQLARIETGCHIDDITVGIDALLMIPKSDKQTLETARAAKTAGVSKCSGKPPMLHLQLICNERRPQTTAENPKIKASFEFH